MFYILLAFCKVLKNKLMKKILFIINPISGIGKQKKLEKIINKQLDKNKFYFDIRYTEYAGHAIEITKKAVGIYDAVIIAGGDGSVNETAQSLINTDTALGIIPAGSGNGFARHLKLPLKPEKALEVINGFKIKTIDTGLFNGKYFLNVAGVGYDAEMAFRFLKLAKRGFFGYAKVVLSSFDLLKGKKMKIKFNNTEIEDTFFLITFANGSQFGLNAKISPSSEIDDQTAELVTIKRFPFIVAPFLALKLFTGNINKSTYVKTYKTNKLRILNTEKIIAHTDGEPFETSGNIIAELLPQSLKIIVPV